MSVRSPGTGNEADPNEADDDDEVDEDALLAREKLAKGPLYMTPGGHKALIVELEALGAERARVVATVSDAAAEGDRSENAEYIYGKRRLRQIDSRMRHLRKIIEAAVLVDPALDRGERVFFGAKITLDDGATSVRYQLVGDFETDPSSEPPKISYRSPMGAALLKKEEGDAVTVDTPSGKRTFTITRVTYR